MDQSTQIQNVLRMLTSLSLAELMVVRATTQSLIDNRPSVRNSRQPRAPQKLVKPITAKKAKQGKPQRPEPKVSEFAHIPEYQVFKTCEKVLKIFLMGQKERGAESNLSYYTNLKDSEMPGLVKDFIFARQAWFRTKAELQHENSQPSEAPSVKPSSKT